MPSMSTHLILPNSSQSFSGSQSLCVLLNESLKAEKMSGLVILEKSWYGLVYSISDREKTGLVLSVFRPNTAGDWVADLKQLVPVAKEQSLQFQIPFKPKHPKSYSPTKYAISLHAEYLQTSLQKLSTYCKSLPAKRNKFSQHCDRLRKMSISFAVPQLWAAVMNLIESEKRYSFSHSLTICRAAVDPDASRVLAEVWSMFKVMETKEERLVFEQQALQQQMLPQLITQPKQFVMTKSPESSDSEDDQEQMPEIHVSNQPKSFSVSSLLN